MKIEKLVILAMVFLLLVKVALATVEITIEYNVTSTVLIGPLSVSPSPADLIAGRTKLVKVSTTVTDPDGVSYISSCSGYLWNPTITPPYTEAKATYTNSSCLLSGCSGITCNCNCSFNLQYYDVYGSWMAGVSGKTSDNKTNMNQSTFVVNSITAVDVANVYGPINASNPSPIVFGTLVVGDVNRPATSNPLKIINIGNTMLKSFMSSDDSVGASDSNWVIGVGNMTYNSTVSGMTTLASLTKTSVQFNPTGGIPFYPNSVAGVQDKATFYIYNYLSIPIMFKAQTYKSTYYLDVEAV